MSSSTTDHESTDLLSTTPVTRLSARESYYIEAIAVLITFGYTFGGYLQPAARAEIYEGIICKAYYDGVRGGVGGLIREWDCKIDAVQSELAYVRGVEKGLGLVATAMAIPYAALAKRYGIRPILSLALFGAFLAETSSLVYCWFSSYFSIRMVWTSFLFELIGGGPTVVMTMLYLIVSECVNDASRSKVFSRLYASSIVSGVVAPIVASFLISYNTWLPWFLGEACVFSTIFFVYLLPKDRNLTRASTETNDGGIFDQGEKRSYHAQIIANIRVAYRYARGTALMITKNKQTVLLLCMAFIGQLGTESLVQMVLLYVSKRYGWSFAQAGLLWSLSSGVQVILLIFLIPLSTNILRDGFIMSPHGSDRMLALASAAIVCIGSVILGLAPSVTFAIFGIILCSIGAGLETFIRSLLTTSTDSDDISVIYSLQNVLRVVGVSLSGPLYSAAFSHGLQLGSVWYGLLYLVAAGLMAVVFGMGLYVKREGYWHSKLSEGVGEEEEEEGLLPGLER